MNEKIRYINEIQGSPYRVEIYQDRLIVFFEVYCAKDIDSINEYFEKVLESIEIAARGCRSSAC